MNQREYSCLELIYVSDLNFLVVWSRSRILALATSSLFFVMMLHAKYPALSIQSSSDKLHCLPRILLGYTSTWILISVVALFCSWYVPLLPRNRFHMELNSPCIGTWTPASILSFSSLTWPHRRQLIAFTFPLCGGMLRFWFSRCSDDETKSVNRPDPIVSCP
jgi:hypothetical protein